jgi:RecA/RadA recombinase
MAFDKKLMSGLLKLEGAVVERRNVHSTVVGSKSPSFNFTWGKGWGLPFGYSVLLFGPEKGGKSLTTNAMVAQLHADYPDAVAVRYNTEMREGAQLTEQQAKLWGIDLDRLASYEVNSPDLIFDPIEKEIPALIQKGLNIRLIIIDSLQGIKGRRMMNNTKGVMQQTIGDLALTLQDGLKQILAIQRKYGIALVLTSQIRAEMDQLEQMRGHKWRAAVSKAVLHHCEYFLWVEHDQTKDSKQDLLGNKFESDMTAGLNDKGERTAHKIRVSMKDSSLGPKGRVGAFTFDYEKGIINTHEEVFLLGVNRNVIDKPNQLTYAFGDRKWAGKAAMLQALKEDSDLCNAIVTELRHRDAAGMFAADETVEPEEPSSGTPVPDPEPASAT